MPKPSKLSHSAAHRTVSPRSLWLLALALAWARIQRERAQQLRLFEEKKHAE